LVWWKHRLFWSSWDWGNVDRRSVFMFSTFLSLKRVDSGEEEARVDGLWVLWYGDGLNGGRRGWGARGWDGWWLWVVRGEIEMFRFRVCCAQWRLESSEKRGVRRDSIKFSIYTRDRNFWTGPVWSG